MVMVPLRAAPVFCATATEMAALPVPLAAEAIVSHALLLTADQVQPAPIESWTDWVLDEAATSIVGGVSVGVQSGAGAGPGAGAGAGPGAGAAAAPCATVNGRSAMVITASRAAPSLASTWKSMLPGPDRVSVAIRTHATLLDTRQLQPLMVATFTRPVPPAPSKLADGGDRSKVQGRPSWVMRTRWAFTATLAEREAIWEFASTFAVKVDSPCPDVVLNRIHETSLDAVHAQSRVVATLMVIAPPSAPVDAGCAVSDV